MKTGKEQNTILDVIAYPLDILKNALGGSAVVLVVVAAIQKAIELNTIATDAISMASLEIARQQIIAELQFAGLTGVGYIALDKLIQFCANLNNRGENTPVAPIEFDYDR